jgi:hypothetical protein
MTNDLGLPAKIAIGGPGRSGTSLLVKILDAAGMKTPGIDTEIEEVNAGRESRIGSASSFDVDKDPWLYQYAAGLPDEVWAEYRALVIPIRNLRDASVSRSKNERVSRIMDNPELDHWEWDTWGAVPGGAVSRTGAIDIGHVLSEGLWTLLEVASTKNVPIVVLNFPTFARDFDYLWDQLGSHLPERITRNVLHDAWKKTVEPTLAREFTSNDRGPGIDEMRGMVADLAGRISGLKQQHAESTLSLGQRAEQVGELETMLAQVKAELVETQERLARTKSIADTNASFAEFLSSNDRRISEINQRLDHLFVVVERSTQPFPRKLARFIQNTFSRRT